MTAPMDGDAIDPAIARVLIFHREAIAQATEKAYLELVDLGVDEKWITPALLGRGWDRLSRGRV